MVHSKKKILHPDFAHRMLLSCDGHPDVPLPNFGRLAWFVEQLEHFQIEVSKETIRKWFAGESRPRANIMGALATVLRVDEAWLSTGKSSGISEKQQKARNAAADGAVNVVAGFIQMNGGHPAFPSDDDARAQEQKIDLYAIIRGAQYAMHVVTGERTEDCWKLSFPVEALDCVVIAVLPTGPLGCSFVEISSERAEEVGQRKGGWLTLSIPFEDLSSWKVIESFSERL